MDSESHQKIVSGHGHLISSSNQAGSSRKGASVEESGPPSPSTGLIINFAEVVPGIYRSSFPQACNFEHMRSLGLTSILTLVPEEYPSQNVTFMKENGIRHFQIAIPAHKDDSVVIPSENLAKALKILLNQSNHPVLIHCNKGKHRTGCIVACYRKIQGWTLGATLTEYRKYAGNKFRALDERFIEGFDQITILAMVKAAGETPVTVVVEGMLPTPPSSLKNYLGDE